MDFWESLAARMPRNLDYETLYERFAWDLPHTYNMGVDICDRNAVDKGKLALIHDRGNGDDEPEPAGQPQPLHRTLFHSTTASG